MYVKYKVSLSVGLIGPTQVGKSTLINAILGDYYLPTGLGNKSCTGIATKVWNNGRKLYTITVLRITLDDIVSDITNLLTASPEQLQDQKFVLFFC